VSLSGGPYPTPGQLTDGTTLFVDLTEEGELLPYAHLLGVGVRHERRPIRDWGVPTVEEMTAILDLIDDALLRGEVVYVHCRAARGRTPTVLGCHRKRHGLEPGRAPETEEQQAFVTRWPEGL
jgi:hypothetical protein